MQSQCWLCLCLLICMATVRAAVVHIDCQQVCSAGTQHDHHQRAHCGCEGHHHHQQVHKYDVTNTKTPAPTTAALTKSTMSICDYLCSVQRGGAACKCSSPVLPGR